jgi:transmembrane sensor
LITPQERDNLTGWRDGRLRFDGQSLADAAKEFNRYNRQQLVIGDADLASLKIGGSFSANDVVSFIAGLQKDFGILARPAGEAGRDATTVFLSRPQSQPQISAVR